MKTSKQSYLEKYRAFLNEDDELNLDNDLAVQIALGYMELKSPSLSLQSQPKYIQQEFDLGIKSEDPLRRETRKYLGRLVELADNHMWTNLSDEFYVIKSLEIIERQLEDYGIEDCMCYAHRYGI